MYSSIASRVSSGATSRDVSKTAIQVCVVEVGIQDEGMLQVGERQIEISRFAASDVCAGAVDEGGDVVRFKFNGVTERYEGAGGIIAFGACHVGNAKVEVGFGTVRTDGLGAGEVCESEQYVLWIVTAQIGDCSAVERLDREGLFLQDEREHGDGLVIVE